MIDNDYRNLGMTRAHNIINLVANHCYVIYKVRIIEFSLLSKVKIDERSCNMCRNMIAN